MSVPSRPKPDFFNLRLRLRPPNFITENFHLSRRFFPLIDYKSFEMALVFEFKKYLQLVVGRGKISSYKQIVTKI